MREMPQTGIIRAAIAQVEWPTTEHWRGVMKRARRDQKVTQDDLARALDVSQPTVSQIEKGEILSSIYVPAICVALRIPEPHVLVEDEWDARWIEAGRVLRHRKPKVFERWLALIEADADPADEQSGE